MALSPEEILTLTSRGWFMNKRKLSPEEVMEIKDEAEGFSKSLLWDLMRKELEYQAFVRGRKGITDRDNDACHYLFYSLDLMEKYLENCRKL